MNIKKIGLSILILILSFSMVAASVLPIKSGTIKRGENAEFWSGRAGVVFTKSQFSGTVRVNRLSDSRIHATNNIAFTHDLVNIQMIKTGGDKASLVIGAVYVYFVVTNRDVRAYEEGELELYRYDSWHNEWAECGSFIVRDDSGKPRIACRMVTFGTFGLGEKK